jgi:predicted RNA-binding Zn ribbon-like protein
MTHAPEQVPEFQFVGGRLCLDFANTLGGTRAHPKEKLLSYQHLVAWGRQAGILTDQEAGDLGEESRRRPEDAAKTLGHAIEIRETIFRIFTSLAGGGAPEHADLAQLNDALSRALAHLRVSKPSTGFVWEWAPDREALDRVLWPVVQSAADVLHSGEVARVGRCGGKDCDWLFLDMSRNHSRRWCDMRDCGNRAKARRHYERMKAQR